MTRICFLSSLHPLRDKRVFAKEAVSLAAAGFEVSHLAPGPGASELDQGVLLLPFAPAQGRMARLRNLPRLLRAAWGADADCYHCNELDSWLVGLLIKAMRRSRVVLDVHEVYPGYLAETLAPAWLHPAVRGLVRGMFALLTPFTDRVVLAKESAAVDFAAAAAKQVLVRNYVPASYAASLASTSHSLQSAAAADEDEPLRAIHLGGMSLDRGWAQLVHALAGLPERTVQVRILGWLADDARSVALPAGIKLQVEPPLAFDRAFDAVCKSDVGLVLFQPGKVNHVHALPHKMFDYMAAGKPVIAPRCAVEVARIIESVGCGLSVDTADPAAIGEALLFFRQHRDQGRRMGECGRQAVLKEFNWERESARLIEMYLHWRMPTPARRRPRSSPPQLRAHADPEENP